LKKSGLAKTEVAVTGNHMTELTTRRPTSIKRRRDQTSGVSAVVLAGHLDCSRAYLQKLEAQGVLHRGPNGSFPLDASRVAYIRHLRRERQQSPKSAAETAFQAAKTRLLEIRIAEREGRLIELDEAVETVAKMMGLLRTELSGLAAQCSRDLPTRRAIEGAVNAMLHRVADEAAARAQRFGKSSATRVEEVTDD
jgi:hypothetical protein